MKARQRHLQRFPHEWEPRFASSTKFTGCSVPADGTVSPISEGTRKSAGQIPGCWQPQNPGNPSRIYFLLKRSLYGGRNYRASAQLRFKRSYGNDRFLWTCVFRGKEVGGSRKEGTVFISYGALLRFYRNLLVLSVYFYCCQLLRIRLLNGLLRGFSSGSL